MPLLPLTKSRSHIASYANSPGTFLINEYKSLPIFNFHTLTIFHGFACYRSLVVTLHHHLRLQTWHRTHSEIKCIIQSSKSPKMVFDWLIISSRLCGQFLSCSIRLFSTVTNLFRMFRLLLWVIGAILISSRSFYFFTTRSSNVLCSLSVFRRISIALGYLRSSLDSRQRVIYILLMVTLRGEIYLSREYQVYNRCGQDPKQQDTHDMY
jgi:hypothetical protein